MLVFGGVIQEFKQQHSSVNGWLDRQPQVDPQYLMNTTFKQKNTTLQKTKPVENGDFPASHVSELRGVNLNHPTVLGGQNIWAYFL